MMLCVYYSNIDNNIIPNCWYILATKERLRKKIISTAKTKLDETTPKDVVFATAVCCGLSSLPGMDINWIKLMLKLFMKFATSLYYSINYIFNLKEYFNHSTYQLTNDLNVNELNGLIHIAVSTTLQNSNSLAWRISYKCRKNFVKEIKMQVHLMQF